MFDKLKMHSPDLTAANIDKIAALFPNCVTERADADGNITRGINFERLKQELSSDVIEHYDECYDFTWVGKNAAIAEGNEPAYIKYETLDEKGKVIEKKTPATLRPCVEESKNWEDTENLYIEGDNLTVLKLLQESYLNSIKMIYIDPPYNTGKDFIYRDNRRQTIDEYEKAAGVYDEDDLIQFSPNLEANPQYHSDWCSMIYPRLQLAKNLLTDDGVIFISIDDNEVHNLRKICDEVFGEGNFITQITRSTGTPTGGGFDIFVNELDYILVYAKNINCVSITGLDMTEEDAKIYNMADDYGKYLIRPLRRTGGEDRREDRPTMFYPLKAPDATLIYPIGPTGYESRWICGKDKYKELEENHLIEWKKDGDNWRVYQKFYLENRKKQPGNLWNNVEGNKKATRDVRNLFDSGKVFDFPKPIEVLIKLMELGISSNDIILDFFSGSATTAHAVMQLNAEDNAGQAGTGNRKFIMVQLPEPCNEKSEAYKAGYKNICEIGKERIRRAGEKINAKIKEDNAQLKLGEEEKVPVDIGFRVFKTDTTNMEDVYYAAGELKQEQLELLVSNIKDGRSDLDLLYGVLLDWGLPLSMKHRIIEIEGVKIHDYDDLSLVACFANNVTETVVREIAKMQPLRVVFKDGSFESSPHRLNVEEIFKLNAPNTSVRVI